jgi:plastocyanin
MKSKVGSILTILILFLSLGSTANFSGLHLPPQIIQGELQVQSVAAAGPEFITNTTGSAAVDSESSSGSPGPDTGIGGSNSQCDPSNNPSTSDTGIAGGSGGSSSSQCDPSNNPSTSDTGIGGGSGGSSSSQCDPSNNPSTLDEGGCGPENPNCCDPDDLPCLSQPPPPPDEGGCGPDNPNCCDPAEPDCEPPPPSPSPPESANNGCFDNIDNDGDGKIDQLDEDCGSGGPGVPTLPGGGAATPRDLRISPVSDRNGPPTILSAAIQTAIPVEAAEREHICDDGIDNDHNSLTDFQDPSCGDAGISALGFKAPPPHKAHIKSTGFAENQTSLHKGIAGIISSGTNQSNSSVISIYGGSKHDIRTISLQYQFSPQKITVDKGSKVTWINQDATENHGISLMDKTSGKIIFSYPVIRYGTSAYYMFENPGVYIYSDPKYTSMMGQITVPK